MIEVDTPSPEQAFFQDEFRRRVFQAALLLAPRQSTLFIRYYFHDIPILGLAVSFGIIPHAVYVALSEARQRVRVLLEQEGLTESAAREYLWMPFARSKKQPRPLHEEQE